MLIGAAFAQPTNERISCRLYNLKRAAWRTFQQRQESAFFSEEKNQKTFAFGARGWIEAMAGDSGAAEV